MNMVRRAMMFGVALGLVAVAAGCDAAAPGPGEVLLGTIDTRHFCDFDPVVGVRLRARWVGCAEAEPGCEPPESLVVQGDRFTCPATDPSRDLGVDLLEGGRYRVEAVAEQTSMPPRIECFVDPRSGELDVDLPWSRLSDETPVRLLEHGPCPQ